jgi:hypothetical protein
MKIRLWGVRGSIPTTGPDTEYYGGNTSCVAVWHDDSLLVLDGGTGIRGLGSSVAPSIKRIDILLTHLHLDHIQGLVFLVRCLMLPKKYISGVRAALTSLCFHASAGIYLRLCFRCCYVTSPANLTYMKSATAVFEQVLSRLYPSILFTLVQRSATASRKSRLSLLICPIMSLPLAVTE